MPINLREVDRDQLYLLPPSLTEWLSEDHLAFFILDVVAELDLSAFYADYREDGRGGAAYDPALQLAVLLYAYCVGERSSRRIERRLREDVAFRVVSANQQLDHTTLARFRRRHAEAIAELFSQVLGLCVAAGLVAAGVVSIDGTKMEANASAWANRTRHQLADEILAEAEAADRDEDERFGEARGDELPADWGRRETGAPGSARRFASSTKPGRRTMRAISSPEKRERPRSATSSRGASPRRGASTGGSGSRTRLTRTRGCSVPATASSRATTPRPLSPKTR